MKYFRRCIVIQTGHTIDIKGKNIPFIRNLSSKFLIIVFYLKVKEQEFTRIFIFIIEFQLMRINFFVNIFKLFVVERLSINLKRFENVVALRLSCFLLEETTSFAIKGAWSDSIGIPTN